jgi:hypothetical protein
LFADVPGICSWNDCRSPARCVGLRPYVERGSFTCEIFKGECSHALL